MTLAHMTYQMRGYCTASGYDRVRKALTECAQLYNAALQERRDAWRMAGKGVTKYDQIKEFTHVRADMPEWAALDMNVGRGVLVRGDRAFKSFFRRVKAGQTPGFPRFKPRQRYSTIELAEVRPGMVARLRRRARRLSRSRGCP